MERMRVEMYRPNRVYLIISHYTVSLDCFLFVNLSVCLFVFNGKNPSGWKHRPFFFLLCIILAQGER